MERLRYATAGLILHLSYRCKSYTSLLGWLSSWPTAYGEFPHYGFLVEWYDEWLQIIKNWFNSSRNLQMEDKPERSWKPIVLKDMGCKSSVFRQRISKCVLKLDLVRYVNCPRVSTINILVRIQTKNIFGIL